MKHMREGAMVVGLVLAGLLAGSVSAQSRPGETASPSEVPPSVVEHPQGHSDLYCHFEPSTGQSSIRTSNNLGRVLTEPGNDPLPESGVCDQHVVAVEPSPTSGTVSGTEPTPSGLETVPVPATPVVVVPTATAVPTEPVPMVVINVPATQEAPQPEPESTPTEMVPIGGDEQPEVPVQIP